MPGRILTYSGMLASPHGARLGVPLGALTWQDLRGGGISPVPRFRATPCREVHVRLTPLHDLWYDTVLKKGGWCDGS